MIKVTFLGTWVVSTLGTVALLFGGLAIAQAVQQGKAASGRDMMPDPNWEPKPGDRIRVSREWAPACFNEMIYDRLIKTLSAGDFLGIEQLFKTHGVAKLPKGTGLLIIKGSRPEVPHDPPRLVDSAEATTSMFLSLLSAGPGVDNGKFAVEVRILDGALAGQSRLVPEEFVAPLVPRPTPKGFFLKLPGEQQQRFQPFVFPKRVMLSSGKTISAASLLAMGQKAERSGPFAEAISCYWLITQAHPEAREAATAEQRLAALGFWRTYNGDLRVDPEHRKDLPDKPKPDQRKPSPSMSARAKSLLRSGQSLETMGKIDGAVNYYRQLIKDFRDSPEANIASERLKKLGRE